VTERELQALAAYVDVPLERDLAPAVRARLNERRPRRRRALVLVLAAVLIAIAVAFAVPPARSGILRFFHLRGETIEYVDKLPEVNTSGQLDLGRPIALADARRIAGFRPLTSALLGTPDRVTWDGTQLWFSYGRTRVLVSQFRATGLDVFVKKLLGSGTKVESVGVNDGFGYFITGADHFIVRLPDDQIKEERLRLVHDVIVWAHGALTLRVEGRLTKAEALRIARSFR
jgi:hypothetical protein